MSLKELIEIFLGSGLLLAVANIYIQNKKVYINSINSTRTLSNNELRKEMAKIIAFCIWKTKNKYEEDKEKVEIKEKEIDFFYSISLVKMQLSIFPEREGNIGHDVLERKLDQIMDINNINDQTAKELLFISRQILSSEWRRVKQEAKGVI